MDTNILSIDQQPTTSNTKRKVSTRRYSCPKCGEATGAEAFVVVDGGRNKIRCSTCGFEDYEKVSSAKKIVDNSS